MSNYALAGLLAFGLLLMLWGGVSMLVLATSAGPMAKDCRSFCYHNDYAAFDERNRTCHCIPATNHKHYD